MKVTVFTSTQPRHLSLIEDLSEVAEVFAVQECKTLFPGQVSGVFPRSPIMEGYFDRVNAAEREVFGGPRFLAPGIRQLVLQRGDLNLLDPEVSRLAMGADRFIVFGANFIKPPLVDLLIEKRAVNLHGGVSPYFRGMSPTFWALFHGRPDLVGSTIHLLSRGMDSGDVLFHAFPKAEAIDPFLMGMKSVKAAHRALVDNLDDLADMEPVPQDKGLEICHARGPTSRTVR